MRLVLVIISFFILPIVLVAQDYHFTQYDKSLMITNPATVGNFEGFERISIQNRNQWIGAGTKFITTMTSAEFTIGKSGHQNKAFGGIGLFFMNDAGGDSKFGMTCGGISISGNIPLARGHRLSAGLQTSFNNRNADFSNLSFYSQWNGSIFDPTIAVDEPNQLASFSYLDAGIGVNYSFDKSSRGSSSKEKKINIGGFIQHINQPKLRYNALAVDHLYAKYGLHVESAFGLSSNMSLEIKVAQFIQGKHYEGLYGAFYKLKFKGSSQITRLKHEKTLSTGLYFRSTGALIPACYLDFGNYRFGVSYDQELGRIAAAYRSSLEFSFSYTTMKKSIFKGKRL